ncbi:hypothetical protein SAMN04490182_2046 [Pseudomonas cedrina]|uniref:Uncharacterized protein n=2 Tax=Pseudomonas cedrina TaxID=651740 RepID=A0A1V2JZS2_PSECE|nr:hypothetical protein [Pseudomonas cedrina]ONH50953.1 hypothetical protein BLL36_23880 [Pseudomonas cedrina subsp. cedrina]SDS65042.1 hypothetical protein SAMN04490182_2046 [Pseudomonas cedrina]
MGLDISAYSKLVLAPDAKRDEDGYLEDWQNFREFNDSDDFPGRLDGIEPGVPYHLSGDNIDFRAGSYSSYNAWRDQLAQMAGYPLTKYIGPDGEAEGYDAGAWAASEGPFFEQIQFTDSDGNIGPIISSKLSKDYAEYAGKAEQIGGNFWLLYQEWQRAFTLAADDGVVIFG